jgi:hypothetical protein
LHLVQGDVEELLSRQREVNDADVDFRSIPLETKRWWPPTRFPCGSSDQRLDAAELVRLLGFSYSSSPGWNRREGVEREVDVGHLYAGDNYGSFLGAQLGACAFVVRRA